MPSGRAHEAINVTAFATLAGGYAYARTQGLTAVLPATETLLAFSASYLIGTFLVTPDLDLAENRVRAKSNWGLLGLLWVPYGAIFSHRGLSHSWVAGPLTRLLYLVLLALALGYAASLLAPWFGHAFQVTVILGGNWRELGLGVVVGYYASQWLHLFADGIQPDHGLRRRRR